MTAPEPLARGPEFTPYLNGFLDGVRRHQLLVERAADGATPRTYGIAELAAVYDLGRDAGRAERPGVDQDVLDTAQRIYDRLAGAPGDQPAPPPPKRPRPRHWPARHLRIAH